MDVTSTSSPAHSQYVTLCMSCHSLWTSPAPRHLHTVNTSHCACPVIVCGRHLHTVNTSHCVCRHNVWTSPAPRHLHTVNTSHCVCRHSVWTSPALVTCTISVLLWYYNPTLVIRSTMSVPQLVFIIQEIICSTFSVLFTMYVSPCTLHNVRSTMYVA